jgi:MraZ protein
VFLGESRHTLDAKNRLRIPAKFRTELGDKYVVTVGSDGCLCVYSNAKFEKYVEKLESIPNFDLQAQRSIRKILSLAIEVEPDEQGRFILPKNLKDFAKIDKNLVINGSGSKIEIWSEEVWDEYSSLINLDEEMAILGEKYGV